MVLQTYSWPSTCRWYSTCQFFFSTQFIPIFSLWSQLKFYWGLGQFIGFMENLQNIKYCWVLFLFRFNCTTFPIMSHCFCCFRVYMTKLGLFSYSKAEGYVHWHLLNSALMRTIFLFWEGTSFWDSSPTQLKYVPFLCLFLRTYFSKSGHTYNISVLTPIILNQFRKSSRMVTVLSQ